jgi:hypothetical protein
MENDDVISVGVTIKEYDDPPLELTSAVAATVDVIVKADESPVVAPDVPDTAIVHNTALPTREGLIL